MDVEGFDLSPAVQSISQHGFQRVVCQFPDEHLGGSTEVYLQLQQRVSPSCELFIAADSTFGSSLDDISAAHVDADLLIYFGSDLSGSGSMNVMIIPPKKALDVQKCVRGLVSAVESVKKASGEGEEEDGAVEEAKTTLLVVDPCYIHCLDSLVTELSTHFPKLEKGMLPPCLGVENNWQPTNGIENTIVNDLSKEQVGGIYFSTQDIARSEFVLFIGEKEEQLSSLFLRLSQQCILHYSPQLDSKDSNEEGEEEIASCVEVLKGDSTRVFRERYGGVSKVKDSKLIGLVVGSMGIETTNLQNIVAQLQKLISAAGKKYYVFVLGRMNEAKLCNFPEIELFCLISNDDNSLIPPKTYHVPVITPFELELGLGARSWRSMYVTSCTSAYGTTSVADVDGEHGMLEDFETRLQRVQETRANRSDSSDSESGDEANAKSYEQYVKSFSKSVGENISQELALVSVNEKSETGGKLIAFESPAAEFLAQRDYQGMSATTEAGTSTKIAQGQFGIASEYERMEEN